MSVKPIYLKKIKPIPFTQDGLEKIKKEYKEVLIARKGAVANLKTARDMGDLSENGLYKAARVRLSQIDNQLNRLDAMIKLARVEEVPVGMVGIGSHVVVTSANQTITFTIVGGYESDPVNHKISNNSPIGRALIGKSVGESVIVEVPAGKAEYTITQIL